MEGQQEIDRYLANIGIKLPDDGEGKLARAAFAIAGAREINEQELGYFIWGWNRAYLMLFWES